MNIVDQLRLSLPNLLAAILVLVIGYVVAVLISGLVRRALGRANLTQRTAGWMGRDTTGAQPHAEEWISRAVFWIILLFVLIAFFQILNLTVITQPLTGLLNQVFQFIPNLIAAGILLLIAWIVATILRFLVTRGLGALGVDQRLSQQAGVQTPGRMSVTRSLGEVVYWLVFLLFLPAILDALGLDGVLQPVQAMLDRFLAFVPNLLGAAVILLVGWFVARLVRRIVTSLLAAAGIDSLAARLGVGEMLGSQGLSGLIGLIVYILILIPIAIAALNALALDAITAPASDMLNRILTAIPNIFAAGLLLALAYIVGRLVAGLVSNLLNAAGFDRLPARLGVSRSSAMAGGRSLSEMAGTLVLAAIMLFAIVEALRLLGFGTLAELVAGFLVFAGQVMLGLIIFALGLWLANLAARAIAASGSTQAGLLARLARIAILVFAGAMALRQMGIANEIINLAFGLLLGAIAVATAIAFGIGGRDVAKRELEGWIAQQRAEPMPPPAPGTFGGREPGPEDIGPSRPPLAPRDTEL